MLKNVAGQKIGAQLVSATDGSAFTGAVTVAVTVDAGTQATGSVGAGACTHEGGGYHTYAPAQAETNGDLLAFTFSGSGAVPVTVQVFTLPTTGVLAPTTLGRTLDVTAANKVNGVVLVDTATTLTNLPAITANWLTAAGIAAGAITNAKFAAGAIDAAAIANGAIDAATFAADVDAEILSYIVDDATRIDASQLNTHTAITVAGIAGGVWDEVLAGHLTAGSTGNALNAAGSAGDPWSTALPGAYGAGTAGFIIGGLTTLFSGITSLAEWLGLIAGKQVGDATARTELRATGAGSGTYDETTDSLEAVRDNHPANFSTLTIASSAMLAKLGDLAHGGTAATLRLGGSTTTPAFYVTNSGGDAVKFESTGNNAHGLIALGNGSGDGGHFQGGVQGDGFHLQGGATTGRGLHAIGPVSEAIYSEGAIAVAGAVSATSLSLSSNMTIGGNWTVTGGTVLTGTVTATDASNDIRGVNITSNVKKNQALASFTFLMTDSTNHEPATGLTVTCTRSIDGAAFAAGTLANVAEVANGIYKVDFGAGDLNGNTIILKATAAAADTTFERLITQP